MAKDVDSALYEVVRQFGGLSSERAADYSAPCSSMRVCT
jgi:sulfite reductase (NADPH) flavoprotein alpha-component